MEVPLLKIKSTHVGTYLLLDFFIHIISYFNEITECSTYINNFEKKNIKIHKDALERYWCIDWLIWLYTPVLSHSTTSTTHSNWIGQSMYCLYWLFIFGDKQLVEIQTLDTTLSMIFPVILIEYFILAFKHNIIIQFNCTVHLIHVCGL